MEGNNRFPTTHWTQLKGACDRSPVERDAALNELILRYWKPVYAYIYRKGFVADAADLTQDFFVHSLAKKLFENADQARGRFRSFLLTCLNRFLIDAHRRTQRQTAVTGVVSISSLAADDKPVIEPVSNDTPEDIFHRVWVRELLARVWAMLEEDLHAAGKETHCELFRLRVYEPALGGHRAPPLTEVAGQYGLTMKEASNRIITVLRAFRKMLTEEIKQYATTDEEIQTEFRDLFRFAAVADSP